MSYSTRRHSAVHASVSSSSHAARGSPSRGWPTLPGLMSHSPLVRSAISPARGGVPLASRLLVAAERQRDVRVADGADALRLGGQAEVGEHRAEDVLPDRVARARVVEPDALGLALGRQAAQELQVLVVDDALRPVRGERRAARELLERQIARHGEVVVAGEDDRAALAGERDARVGIGPVAHEIAQAPDSRRRPARRSSASTASKAWRFPWTSERRAVRICNSGASAPSTARRAGRHRRGRGRRGGSCGAHVASPRRDRTGAGARSIVLQRDRARAST